MVKQCASCGLLKQAELHTSGGWLCIVCVRSATTVVVTYVINGVRFMKSLKEIQQKETPTRSVAGAVSPFHRKETK